MGGSESGAKPGSGSDSKGKKTGLFEAVKIWGGVALIVIVGLVIAYQFVEPGPPESIVLATGSETGAYHAYGLRYQEALSRYGITVHLRTTAGSVENVGLLRNGEADVAFVQSGVVPAETHVLEGIGSLYFEPLWLFHRSDEPIEQLTDLLGKRVQVGATGSGTRSVATRLLRLNGIDESNADLKGLSSMEAVEQLLAGEIDAAFIVISPTSKVIGQLMSQEGGELRLLDMDRALAYERTFPYLSEVVLPEGGLDFQQNIPDRSIDLVSPAATLICTEDLHPAIIPLFIMTAETIHGGGDLLAPPGTFPSPLRLDVPISTAANEYYTKGLSFLYRVFPFPVAATLDRLKIMLLPLLTLLFPLFKIAGPLYAWRIRRKIFRWYAVLRGVERRFETARDTTDVSGYLQELGAVETEINAVNVPASYMEELYNLRMHLALVQQKVRAADSAPA